MIEKRTTLPIAVDVLRHVFCDTDAWPRWMPGVTATKVLRRRDGYRLIEVRQTHFGHTFVQDLECWEEGDTVRHRQHRGWFRRWEADWTFHRPPAGDGTALLARVDFEMGMLALLSPKPVVWLWMRNHLDRTVEQACGHARRLPPR